MFVIYGQFWNQTRLSWDWQQIGGTPTNREDAHEFAFGFAQRYNVPTKVVTRVGTTMFLPPVADEGQALTWPVIDESMIPVQHVQLQ